MKVKKILAGITALCMLYGAIPASNQQKIFTGKTMTANAADSYSENSGTTENGLEYLIYTDVDCIAITGYSGSETNVEIPASINGLPVESIENGAFSNCTKLTSITIPDSVTYIGFDAFSGCTGLTSITLPNSIVDISSSTFSGCRGLTSIIIPDGVTHIGYDAFSGCTGLTSITIPDSVTYIGDNAFYNTAWYENQPDGLIYAGKVLYKYKGEMPENTEIKINDGTKVISSSAFWCCSRLTSIIIPDSVTRIGNDAFFGTSLTSVTIPKGVTSIDDFAFSCCTDLTKFNVSENNENYASVDGVLFNKEKNCLVLYPNGKSDKKYIIPDSVKAINRCAFNNCTELTEITIPDSVTNIEDFAFYGCTNLKSIEIPNTITDIKDGMFFGCSALTSISIPDSVTNIEEYAFWNCTGLTEITIPNSVTNIGDNAFSGCTGLTEIIIPDSVISIKAYAFKNCTGLTEMEMPDSVTSIEMDAFSGCTELTSITIKNPECEFGDSTDTISDTAAIYGYDDSTAQAYAEKYNRKFVSLGEKPNIPISKTGDADLNGTIDAIDASIALTIYALKSTGGDVSSYTDEQLAAADADKNGTVDAIDASHILSYYAYISTGGSKTFDEFI